MILINDINENKIIARCKNMSIEKIKHLLYKNISEYINRKEFNYEKHFYINGLNMFENTDNIKIDTFRNFITINNITKDISIELNIINTNTIIDINNN